MTFDPDGLRPRTRAVWNLLLEELLDIGEDPAYVRGHDLIDRLAAHTSCSPRTVSNVISSARAFGLLHGLSKIRPTTLGRAWLHHAPSPRNAR